MLNPSFQCSPKPITTAPHIALSDTRALNLINVAVRISETVRVVVVKIQRCCIGCSRYKERW
jgi:hypothetical protein